MTFGDILKILRKNKKMTQSDLAKELNVDRSTIGKWENDSSTPDFQKLLKIAAFFDVETDFLLGNFKGKKRRAIMEKILHVIYDLTSEEEEKLIEYAKFLRTQRLTK